MYRAAFQRLTETTVLVKFRILKAEGSYFDQDQFMQQYTTAHIGDGDTGHDNNRTNHESLSPCLENEAWARGFGDVAIRSHVDGDGDGGGKHD
jgi:hypothetical protein